MPAVGSMLPGAVAPPPPAPAPVGEAPFPTIEERALGKAVRLRLHPPARGSPGLYEVLEPPLAPDDRRLLERIRSALPQVLPGADGPVPLAERPDRLREAAVRYLEWREPGLTGERLERLLYYLLRDAAGYGPIDPLLRDPEIEDIFVDGVGIPVYVFHRHFESLPTNLRFDDEAALNNLIVRLAQRCGRALAVRTPMLDGTTPEGHRIHLTFRREVSSRGPSLSLRRATVAPFSPRDLIREGTASPELAAYLWLAADAGEPLLVAGGTGAGKTSTLNALAHFFPATDRIVSIEDARELRLPQERWLPLVTRPGYGEPRPDGKRSGEIDLHDLVRFALRERPDRIVVGEIRGRESYALFQAAATGHPTYTTAHADSWASLVHRLEQPPIGVPRALLAALSVVAVQVQVRRPDGVVRRIREVTELDGIDPESGELLSRRVFAWNPPTDRIEFHPPSRILERFAAQRGISESEALDELDRRAARLRPWTGDGGGPPGALPGDLAGPTGTDPDSDLRSAGLGGR
ncbi:MAG: type II/IV secretion system ATPase subunit [Thermoplasmata archaeon]